MIDRSILFEYSDLCAQVEETQIQLNKLIRAQKEAAHDSVKGSNPNFPYEPITFHITGLTRCISDDDVEKMRRILTARKDAAKNKRIEVEEWINTIPVRMQRIVRMKFIEGRTWADVALRLGVKNVSGDAIRKEFWSFLEKSQPQQDHTDFSKENP